MTFGQFFAIAIPIAIIFFAIYGFGEFIKTPTGKGWLGEHHIKKVLKKIAPWESYIINNLTFSDDKGHTCQIDHIFISKKGVFVIETKNYSGKIYGTEYQHEWTQVLAYGKKKVKFYNPVHQNNTHIHRLKQLLKEDVNMISVVVFTQGKPENVKSDNVYSISGMKKLLKSGKDVLNEIEMQHIYYLFMDIKDNNSVASFQHISTVNQTITNINNNICPRCGAKLVKRHSKYGYFFGCEKYPKCKFKKK